MLKLAIPEFGSTGTANNRVVRQVECIGTELQFDLLGDVKHFRRGHVPIKIRRSVERVGLQVPHLSGLRVAESAGYRGCASTQLWISRRTCAIRAHENRVDNKHLSIGLLESSHICR